MNSYTLRLWHNCVLLNVKRPHLSVLEIKWLYRSFTGHPITRSLISWYFLAPLLYKYWNPGYLISRHCWSKPDVDKHCLVCYSTGRLSLIFLQQARNHSDRRLPFTSGYALRFKTLGQNGCHINAVAFNLFFSYVSVFTSRCTTYWNWKWLMLIQ